MKRRVLAGLICALIMMSATRIDGKQLDAVTILICTVEAGKNDGWPITVVSSNTGTIRTCANDGTTLSTRTIDFIPQQIFVGSEGAGILVQSHFQTRFIDHGDHRLTPPCN